MNREERSNAYRRLTRELRTMHHTERTRLDFAPNLTVILTAVHEGRLTTALALTDDLRTPAGDMWRGYADKAWRGTVP